MRASYLLPKDEFFRASQIARPMIVELESVRIDDAHVGDDIADQIWRVVDGLGWQKDQQRTFRRIHNSFARVARAADPAAYVTGTGWRTSRTKVIDNAVITYCKLELSDNRVDDHPARQVTFTVEGSPPAKSEALSMLGAGHPHTMRVRSLLRAAQEAITRQDFTPVASEAVALEVVVHTAAGERLSCATNVLGGVADVPENKAHRGALEHLGNLAAVWIYENDRQIKQVAYREVTGPRSFYTVTIGMIT